MKSFQFLLRSVSKYIAKEFTFDFLFQKQLPWTKPCVLSNPKSNALPFHVFYLKIFMGPTTLGGFI